MVRAEGVAPKDAAVAADKRAVLATTAVDSHTAVGAADPLVDNSNGVVLTVSGWSTGLPRPSPA